MPCDSRSADTGSVLHDPAVNIGGLGDAGEMLDAQAKQNYKRRLLELSEELEDLRERGDHERAANAESEIDSLRREIARAVGLGGRDRRACPPPAPAPRRVTPATTPAAR